MKRISILFAVLLCIAACTSDRNVNKTNVQHPEWIKDAVLYQVNVRQFTPEGTFAALEGHLDRLSELGVDVLWLMPVHPIGVEGRKGSLGSYYSPRNLKEVNPEFGTMADFDHFLATAHDKGFKVILDWVANHTSRDADWTVDHNDWYFKDSLGNLAVQYDWTDIAHLNYENNEALREAMTECMEFWVKKGIDGFRCDVASEVPVDFWETAFSLLRSENPDLFFLAEAEKPELQVNAFDSYYSWQRMNLFYEIAEGKVSADSLSRFYLGYEQNTGMPHGTLAMNFLSNHDQNSWTGTNEAKYGSVGGVRQMAALTFTLAGIPMLYTADEICLPKQLQFFEKDPVDWTSDPGNMADFYKGLISLRDAHQCLWAYPWGGEMTVTKNSHPQDLFSFHREVKGDAVDAYFNFSDDALIEDQINIPAHGYAFKFDSGDIIVGR